jgi:hypothetical protein
MNFKQIVRFAFAWIWTVIATLCIYDLVHYQSKTIQIHGHDPLENIFSWFRTFLIVISQFVFSVALSFFPRAPSILSLISLLYLHYVRAEDTVCFCGKLRHNGFKIEGLAFQALVVGPVLVPCAIIWEVIRYVCSKTLPRSSQKQTQSRGKGRLR